MAASTAVKRSKPTPQRLTEGQRAELLRRTPAARFAKDGWYPLSSAIFSNADKFAPGGAQLLAVQWIMFQQFQTPDVAEWIKVSVRDLEKATAGAYTSKAFDLALADAAKRGLVIREKRGREWWYQVFPEDWAAADEYEKLGPVELPKPEAKEKAPESDAGVVAPGKSSKPVILSFQIAVPGVEKPMAADLNFRLQNESGVPLSCRSAVDGKNFVCIVSGSEEKANARVVDYTSKRSDSAASVKNQRLSEIRSCVASLLDTHFKYALVRSDEPLVLRVSKNLGPDAPVSMLESWAAAEIADMRKRRKNVSRGILEFFATQVRNQFASAPPVPAATSPAPAAFATAPDATAWPKIREKLAAVVGVVVAETWFVKSRGVSADGATLVVSVPDAATATFLAEEYAELVDRTAAKVALGVERVRFVAQGE